MVSYGLHVIPFCLSLNPHVIPQDYQWIPVVPYEWQGFPLDAQVLWTINESHEKLAKVR